MEVRVSHMVWLKTRVMASLMGLDRRPWAGSLSRAVFPGSHGEAPSSPLPALEAPDMLQLVGVSIPVMVPLYVCVFTVSFVNTQVTLG